MNMLILTYHYFHSDSPQGISREDFPFSISIDAFSGHCEELASSGLDLISAQDLSDPATLVTNSNRQVLVSIDDGHFSVLEIVDIVSKHNIRPVLFVIPDRVGGENYLGWPGLRSLHDRGFSVQSHSLTHRDLTRLDRTLLTRELTESRDIIAQKIGAAVTMLAAPMGRINRGVAAASREAGYQILMTSYTGINKSADDLLFARRFQVKSPDTPLRPERYFNPFSPPRIKGAAKNAVKRIRRLVY